MLEVIAAVGGSEADRKAFPPHLMQKQALVIPVGVTSKKREHWDRYGELVSRNFQPVPHFDALAPSLADMARCTPLTRAIQTMSEYQLLKHLDELELHALDGNGASPLISDHDVVRVEVTVVDVKRVERIDPMQDLLNDLDRLQEADLMYRPLSDPIMKRDPLQLLDHQERQAALWERAAVDQAPLARSVS